MTPKPRHICGFLTGRGRHQPHCDSQHRREEGCWCFLYAEKPKLTARQWRAERRKVSRCRRRFRINLKRMSFNEAFDRSFS